MRVDIFSIGPALGRGGGIKFVAAESASENEAKSVGIVEDGDKVNIKTTKLTITNDIFLKLNITRSLNFNEFDVTLV